MPIVVALKVRDANRAVALLRLGAAEVVAPPWTREHFSACLAKNLRYQGTALSLVQTTPKKRSAYFYFFAVLAFFALALGAASMKRQVALRQQESARHFEWDLPYTHPAGVTFDGQDLWVLDWFTQSLYVHRPDEAASLKENLPIRRIVHFPGDGETPVAISLAADAAWSVDAAGAVMRHMKDSRLTVIQKYENAAPAAQGIVFDGLYLWTCDGRQKKLVKHLVDDQLTVLASYPYAGVAPAALVFDGKALWSLDSVNRELLRHNLERPEEVTRRISLPEYRDGRYKPVGMTWDGKRFWTVGERLPKNSGPARLFAHQILKVLEP